MTKINVAYEGKFLSGRSHAVELVDRLMKSQPNLPIVFDLDGVESVSQAFVSELLVALKKYGIQFQEINFTGVKDKEIEARIRREIERLSQLMAS